jgi:hypothetical protein
MYGAFPRAQAQKNKPLQCGDYQILAKLPTYFVQKNNKTYSAYNQPKSREGSTRDDFAEY